MSPYEKGIDIVDKVLAAYNWPRDKTILIEGLRNFGDTLHTSVVVRHYRKLYPNHMIIWGITERYFKQFKDTADALGVLVFNLPHDVSHEDRQNWKKHFETYGLFKVISPCCAVSGWSKPGTIVDNVLSNAGISSLKVPKRPFFLHSGEDYSWHDRFCKTHNLRGRQYAVIEYNSYTLSQPPHNITWSIDKYNELVSKINCPVVFTAAKDEQALATGIDARGCSWTQAKVMIERAGCLVGCGSGLSVLSCTEGLNTYVIEINIGETLTVKNMYGISSVSAKTDDTTKVANAINKCIAGFSKK